jgi:hypothetical protein
MVSVVALKLSLQVPSGLIFHAAFDAPFCVTASSLGRHLTITSTDQGDWIKEKDSP